MIPVLTRGLYVSLKEGREELGEQFTLCEIPPPPHSSKYLTAEADQPFGFPWSTSVGGVASLTPAAKGNQMPILTPGSQRLSMTWRFPPSLPLNDTKGGVDAVW